MRRHTPESSGRLKPFHRKLCLFYSRKVHVVATADPVRGPVVCRRLLGDLFEPDQHSRAGLLPYRSSQIMALLAHWRLTPVLAVPDRFVFAAILASAFYQFEAVAYARGL